MQLSKLAGPLFLLVIGSLLLVFNKPIGNFGRASFGFTLGIKFIERVPWFPRLSDLTIGLFFVTGAILDLWNNWFDN
jgi:hypothetical protein